MIFLIAINVLRRGPQVPAKKHHNEKHQRKTKTEPNLYHNMVFVAAVHYLYVELVVVSQNHSLLSDTDYGDPLGLCTAILLLSNGGWYISGSGVFERGSTKASF